MYINEQKRPTPACRQLSLTKDALCLPIPIGLVLTLCMKAWIADILEYFMFHCVFVHWALQIPISDTLSNSFRSVVQIGSYILVSLYIL